MKRFFQSTSSLYTIAFVIIALDQLSKAIVRSAIPLGSYYSLWDWLTPFARFVHITNTGVAFGMFQGNNALFIILAAIVSVVIMWYYPRVPAQDITLRLALGLELAGAAGNLIDRIFFGFVTDFVSVGNFAVFNIADASITVGVAVMLLGLWFQEHKKKPDAPNDEEQASSVEPAAQ